MKQPDRYEIIEELGRGGFATVYKARDTQLNRLVALKVMHAGLINDPDFVRRYYQEAATTAQFNHPNIVTIYDIGEIEGQLFISMEYIPGQNLRQWLEDKGRPLSLPEALTILQPLAAAIDYAHKRGIVHRDIKPSNVMINEADGDLHVVLTDFGLVKAIEKSVYLTMTDQILGTPEYMAPEQTDPNRHGEIGPHTDLYALGVVAYRMLAGRVPFPGNSISTLHAQANLAAPPPQKYNAKLSQKVAADLLQMLAKAPADRYPTAAAFVAALQIDHVKGGVTSTTPDSNQMPDGKTEALSERVLPFSLWVIGSIVGIVLLAIIVLNLPNFVRLLVTPTAEIGNPPTRPEQEGTTVIAVVTGENDTANATMTLEADQSENEITTPVAQIETATATVTFSPTPTPSGTPSPTPTLDPYIRPDNPTLGSTWTRAIDEMVMVYVPAGTFPMGANPEIDPDAEEDEQPQHQVTLDSFWIDQTEVSFEQFSMCVQDEACNESTYREETDFNGDAQPVVGVRWTHAEDYCTWVGGQLPTEAQWEYAARGGTGQIYPWGNVIDGQKVNFCDINCTFDVRDVNYNDGTEFTAPVGSYPDGESWVGALDMAGNVWEWVSDWYDEDYYADSPEMNPTGPENGESKVLRGGSWVSPANIVRSTDRYNNLPANQGANVGFRCAYPVS